MKFYEEEDIEELNNKRWKKPKVGIESSEEFRLNPSTPKGDVESSYYDPYWPVIGATPALSNLQPSDLWIRGLQLQNIQSKLNYGDTQWARDDMIQMLAYCQNTRGIEGFETRFGRQGIQRSESEIRERHIDLTPAQEKAGKISRLFSKKQQETVNE